MGTGNEVQHRRQEVIEWVDDESDYMVRRVLKLGDYSFGDIINLKPGWGIKSTAWAASFYPKDCRREFNSEQQARVHLETCVYDMAYELVDYLGESLCSCGGGCNCS